MLADEHDGFEGRLRRRECRDRRTNPASLICAPADRSYIRHCYLNSRRFGQERMLLVRRGNPGRWIPWPTVNSPKRDRQFPAIGISPAISPLTARRSRRNRRSAASPEPPARTSACRDCRRTPPRTAASGAPMPRARSCSSRITGGARSRRPLPMTRGRRRRRRSRRSCRPWRARARAPPAWSDRKSPPPRYSAIASLSSGITARLGAAMRHPTDSRAPRDTARCRSAASAAARCCARP